MVKSKILMALALAAGAAIDAQSYYSLADLRKHAKASDCWIAIRGSVYDVTKYVPQHHKFDFDIAPYCGTEATNFWNKKPESGDSHSRKAEMLLRKYKIGELARPETTIPPT